MPYTVQERDDEYCVYKEENGEAIGEALGCHDTAQEAGAQIAAIEREEETRSIDAPDPDDAADLLASDALVAFGSSIKALGDGKIGGYLVEFTDLLHPDLEDDYFDAQTDYGPHTSSLVFYHHGADEALGTKSLTHTATLEPKDAGVWMEHQLDIRDAYESAIYQLAEEGKLGLSSGTASHLIERERKDNGVYHIARWPLGLDASYTPTPANANSHVMPLKSYIKSVGSVTLEPRDVETAEDEPHAKTPTPQEDIRASESGVADRRRATAQVQAIDAYLHHLEE